MRIEPAPEGTGIEFRLATELRTIPLYIFGSVEEFEGAMEENVKSALQQGLFGWRVTDCIATMTESGFVSPASGARDCRLLTPLVLLGALLQAGTVVCELIQHIHLEVPIAGTLARLGAVLQTSTVRGSLSVLEGDIPAVRVLELQHQMPMLTRGEGVLETGFSCYRPVPSTAPTRPRTDRNPLNRKEYLLHVSR